MKISKTIQRTSKVRRAAILTEALVSAVILMAGIGIVARTQYNLRRLWGDTRHFQLATDELGNQLDRLTQMPKSQAVASLSGLQVSPEIASVLPDCRIEGNLVEDSLGSRIHLKIDWKRVGTGVPLELTGWLRASNQPEGRSSEKQTASPSDSLQPETSDKERGQ